MMNDVASNTYDSSKIVGILDYTEYEKISRWLVQNKIF